MALTINEINQLRLSPKKSNAGSANSLRVEGLAGTYFLFESGRESAWHKTSNAVAIWHWHAGSPLLISTATESGRFQSSILGLDIAGGQRPQLVVQAEVWQSAYTLGEWTLLSRTLIRQNHAERVGLSAPTTASIRFAQRSPQTE